MKLTINDNLTVVVREDGEETQVVASRGHDKDEWQLAEGLHHATEKAVRSFLDEVEADESIESMESFSPDDEDAALDDFAFAQKHKLDPPPLGKPGLGDKDPERLAWREKYRG